MNKLELAYAAGVIDSDGCIGIKRSTYSMRVRGDATQPIYFERITVKQVETQAVALLHLMFGGHRGITDPSAKRGRPLHHWHIHSASAGKALVELLPYLRIKRKQAENAIRMRVILKTPRRWPVPAIVKGEPLVTATEFASLVGVKAATIMQATQHKSIPSVRIGRSRMIPISFADAYRARIACGGKVRRAESVTDKLEECYLLAKELNRVGIR